MVEGFPQQRSANSKGNPLGNSPYPFCPRPAVANPQVVWPPAREFGGRRHFADRRHGSATGWLPMRVNPSLPAVFARDFAMRPSTAGHFPNGPTSLRRNRSEVRNRLAHSKGPIDTETKPFFFGIRPCAGVFSQISCGPAVQKSVGGAVRGGDHARVSFGIEGNGPTRICSVVYRESWFFGFPLGCGPKITQRRDRWGRQTGRVLVCLRKERASIADIRPRPNPHRPEPVLFRISFGSPSDPGLIVPAVVEGFPVSGPTVGKSLGPAVSGGRKKRSPDIVL